MSALSTPEAVAVSFAAQCDCGKVRAENQDTVRQCATPIGELLVVADGIGGYEGGGVASRMAVEAIAAALEGMPAFFPVDIAIEEAVCRANAEIVAAAAVPDTPNNQMGSTVVLALLQQDAGNAKTPVQAWIGHIGDSRAYLLHDRRLTRVTRDHSAIQLLLDHDLVSPEEARDHPDASVLTRTLGHEPNVKVDLNTVELAPGDTLLLCSDGLWGYVSDQEIERVLADPELTAEQASRSLLDLALDAGGHDNIGIQLARLTGTGTAAPAREAEPAYDSDSLPEQLRAYLLIEEPPALWAPSAAQREPLEDFSSAPPPISLEEPETASLAIWEAAVPASSHFDSASFRLESARELETAETHAPENLLAEIAFSETRVEPGPVEPRETGKTSLEEFHFPEDEITDLHAFEWRNTKLVLEPARPEDRVTTIVDTAADLWEMFVYPLGRDFDFAPEWHVDLNSIYENMGEDKTLRQSITLPSFVAGLLVACASPKRALESVPAQDSHLSARFKSSTTEVSTLLKFLGILLLGFCVSCGLVYCALFQNWFGIDQILHLR
jgi:protein phosphatase